MTTAIADADGWIPWDGKECPMPEGRMVDIKYRDGGILAEVMLPRRAWKQHEGTSSDIMYYRPCELIEPPLELNEHDYRMFTRDQIAKDALAHLITEYAKGNISIDSLRAVSASVWACAYICMEGRGK